MTTHDREEVIAAAKEAAMGEPLMGMTPPEIISFVGRLYAIGFEAGRQAEREECAVLCEYLPVGCGFEGRTFADAIRARSTK